MEEKNSDATEGKKISAMAPEDIFIMTELARIGRTHLGQILPEIRNVVSTGKSAITPENLAHLESLYSEGADSLAHFGNMCLYLEEQASKFDELKKKIKNKDE